MISSEITGNEMDTNVDLSQLNGDGRLNHKIVRLDYDWEVIYWCLVLRCTKKELEDAVKRVGTNAADIRNLLNGN